MASIFVNSCTNEITVVQICLNTKQNLIPSNPEVKITHVMGTLSKTCGFLTFKLSKLSGAFVLISIVVIIV